MQEFLIMLKNVIMFVLLAIPGYIAVKTKLFKSSDSTILSKIVLYVAVPFFIISSTLNIDLNGEKLVKFLVFAIIFVIIIFALFFLSKPFAKDEKNAGEKGLLRFCIIFSNNGFLGLPLAEAIFGGSNPDVIAYLVVVNVVNNILLIVMGSYMISGEKKHISAKGILTSPVLIAFVIGIILNLIDINSLLPEVAIYSNYLKNLVTPLSMTILGMNFAGISILKLFKNKKVYYVSIIKLLIFPIIVMSILLIINIFAPIENSILMAVFIGLATPTASLATSLADRFNVGIENATLFVLGSTLFSVVSLPILYALLSLFL